MTRRAREQPPEAVRFVAVSVPDYIKLRLARSTEVEEGLYLRLMHWHWQGGGTLPVAVKEVAARLYTDNIEALRRVLTITHRLTPEGWRHDWSDLDGERRRQLSESRAVAGAAGGRAKAGKKPAAEGLANGKQPLPNAKQNVASSLPSSVVLNAPPPVSSKPPEVGNIAANAALSPSSVQRDGFPACPVEQLLDVFRTEAPALVQLPVGELYDADVLRNLCMRWSALFEAREARTEAEAVTIFADVMRTANHDPAFNGTAGRRKGLATLVSPYGWSAARQQGARH